MEREGSSSTGDRGRAAIEASYLRSLPHAVVDGLMAGSRLLPVEAGSVVRWEGDATAHFDLVVTGLVRVFVTAPDGRSLTVRYVRPGGLLGAVSLFASPFVLPATIQAVTDAELLRLAPSVVRRAADTDVRVARALIDELTERVLSFIPEIPGSVFATVRQRVARHLLDLASGSPASGVLLADIGQQELADAVGTVREVVVRALRQLREAGLIRTGRDGVVIHWDIPMADPQAWRLSVDGAVSRPVRLNLTDLRARPARTVPVTLECAGNGRGWLEPRPVSLPWLGEAIGTAEWTGTPLGPLLEEAGVQPEAVEVVFHGLDRGIQGGEDQTYARSLPLAEAMRSEVLVAYEMNGEPLPPQHGFPLRLVVPGWYGMASVKWLHAIEVLTEPFDGFQQAVAYRYQAHGDEPGEPVSRIRPRAMMIPPGIPDFFTRHRYVDAGTVMLSGRAWSGHGPVERVEVGIDGQWADADLDPPVGEFAWRGWHFEWHAEPGEHQLYCRASDATGKTQPPDAPWNHQGMGNNMVQRVEVTVR
jgi:DMSO/TMAO reductase YedYZ molybdopterin-dependent catalytic subunit